MTVHYAPMRGGRYSRCGREHLKTTHTLSDVTCLKCLGSLQTHHRWYLEWTTKQIEKVRKSRTPTGGA